MLPSDHDALLSCASEVGVEVPDDFFASDAFADAVRVDEAAATEYGISGVPTMIIDGRFILSGAQGPDTMLSTFQRAFARRSALS